MINPKYIDHTLLKPTASKEDIVKLCAEAREYDFKSVCVNPYWVSLASQELKNSDVLVCTVIDFPLGAGTINSKLEEIKTTMANGGTEFDVVVNNHQVKSRDSNLLNELSSIRALTKGYIIKLIIETCYLEEDDIRWISDIGSRSGFDFIKTSTGFGNAGASVRNIEIMNEAIKGRAMIKASGGVRSKEDYLIMVAAGATRIGTSNGVLIVKGEKNDTNTTY